MIAMAVLLCAAAAGAVTWRRSDASGTRTGLLTQVWAVHESYGEYDRVLAVWSTPRWLIRVTDMGPTAYNWSDGKAAWNVTEMYFSAASGKLSADGIGTLSGEDPDAKSYLGFDALHGKNALPGRDGGATALQDPDVPHPQTPRPVAGHRTLAEIVPQDPDTGKDVGRFQAPASLVAGHAQYVVRGPDGLIVSIPLTNNDGYPVAFRRS
ncbi:hypothetical protein V2S66_30925 [Streptomyces sp. V4-01]|uniref:Uncharacterized protein n=1 Tax=Actinacidiphila polyblastidii TaxID=3110430 RepID=A0ABU7PKJ7_9ACTN|nr:hypothetical protein [Streptomyces sp. V4-01]